MKPQTHNKDHDRNNQINCGYSAQQKKKKKKILNCGSKEVEGVE